MENPADVGFHGLDHGALRHMCASHVLRRYDVVRRGQVHKSRHQRGYPKAILKGNDHTDFDWSYLESC